MIGKKMLLVTVVCIAFGAPSAYATEYERPKEILDIQTLKVFGSGEDALGAVKLTRDMRNRLLSADISATGLVPDEAYSIWWVVFNSPWRCATRYECMGPDLGNEAVRGTAFWAGGFIADGLGSANLTITVGQGKNEREVFAGGQHGLKNLKSGEVHIVLRSHGPAGVAGPVATQVGTANEACPPEGCQNRYFSVHRVPR